MKRVLALLFSHWLSPVSMSSLPLLKVTSQPSNRGQDGQADGQKKTSSKAHHKVHKSKERRNEEDEMKNYHPK